MFDSHPMHMDYGWTFKQGKPVLLDDDSLFHNYWFCLIKCMQVCNTHTSQHSNPDRK